MSGVCDNNGSDYLEISQDLVATKSLHFNSAYEIQIYDTIVGNPLHTLVKENEFNSVTQMMKKRHS